jgi:deoxyribodipyrimidine photo-lyase
MIDLGHLLGCDRERLVAELARAIPEADRAQSHASVVGMPIRGGRRAAVARMTAIDPVAYARTRNHVAGAVTGLSPWIRHGVVSLAEVRDHAIGLVRRPDDAAKLVSELGWRDYWRQVHAALGDRIRESIEPPAALPRSGGSGRVPKDVLAAATGMECIDAFVRRLHDTGWLHNH